MPLASVRSPEQCDPPAARAPDRAGTLRRRRRILFLHPKTLTDSWPFPVDTLGEVVKAPSAVYPVLAAVVSDLPYELEIFDGYVARESFANYKRRLAGADILAITVMSPLKALDTELTIRLARSLNRDVTIILGGNHASAFARQWIEVGADFVVVGEGEVAFRALMQALAAASDLGAVPNLVYRGDDGIRVNSAKAPKVHLDEAPIPRWDLMDLRPYGLGLGSGGLTAAVEVSRGCPHRCDFCNINTFWDYKQRYKSVERVCAELEALRSQGVREFIFTDDNFGQDHRHARLLFEEMIRRRLDMRFGSFMRGDTVSRHPELIELAAQAGFSFCLMGIETLDPRWLKSHGKGVRATDAAAMYASVYQVLRRNGVFVIGLFITPAEAGANDVSGRGADGLVCDVHYTADLVAQKGSALYDTLLQQGAVGKSMFYHDWNLPSIVPAEGRPQVSRKSFRTHLRHWNPIAIRDVFFGKKLARRFRHRNLAIIAERLLCTSMADLRRYRIAKDSARPLEQRQREIAHTVVGPAALHALLRAGRHKSPLSLRTAIWSPARPLANGVPHERSPV